MYEQNINTESQVSEEENLEISKIKLANGQIYNIIDKEARKGLEYLLGKKY